MEKKSEIIFNSMFEYDSFTCHCTKDIENVAPDAPPKTTLKIHSEQGKPLHFSYSSKEGLNLTGPAGGAIEKNILGKILAIPEDDIDAHITFFEKFGFLLPLPFDEYASIDSATLIGIVNRIKATIRLMNALGKRDHKRMLIHIAYLLFSEPINCQIGEAIHSTCAHPFTKLVNNYNLFPDINREPEAFVKSTWSVNDTILNGSNPISIEFYNAIRSGAGTDIPGSKSTWFKNVVALYTSRQAFSPELRVAIDFFFHLFTEHGVIESVSFSKIHPFRGLNVDNLSEEMKNSLVQIARMTIAEEINHNIRGIHPRYNGYRLSATWEVNTLLEAIYFSVFYMRAGIEIYKECENRNCKRDKFFLVEATRSNKKYCCPQCANAAAAQRHRNKQ